MVTFISPTWMNELTAASSLLKGRGRGKTHVTLIQEMNGQWEVSLSINHLCYDCITPLTIFSATALPLVWYCFNKLYWSVYAKSQIISNFGAPQRWHKGGTVEDSNARHHHPIKSPSILQTQDFFDHLQLQQNEQQRQLIMNVFMKHQKSGRQRRDDMQQRYQTRAATNDYFHYWYSDWLVDY